MKKLKFLLFAAVLMPFLMHAQEETYRMVELSYMKAKVGMESKFEAAVKAHNAKYHKEGNDHCAILWAPLGGHGCDSYYSGYYNQVFIYYMERFMYLYR